ncbi:MAG: hypothetical protein ABJA98_27855 [Acidobacteriota bacterium]
MSRRVRVGGCVLAVLLAASSARAFVLVVFDPEALVQNKTLNALHELLTTQLGDTLKKMQHLTERIQQWVPVATYVLTTVAPPAWRTRYSDGALAISDGFLFAVNGTAPAGPSLAAASKALHDPTTALGRVSEDPGRGGQMLRAELATIQIAASAMEVAMAQTGAIRNNRKNEVAIIAQLEKDVLDQDPRYAAAAVADKISGALLIAARQGESRLQLAAAIAEQLAVQQKRKRDTDVIIANMRIEQLQHGQAQGRSYITGSADAIRAWRQP